MTQFLIFLAKLAIINVILFILITFIASKLIFLRKNKTQEKKSADIIDKISSEKTSVLGFEREKYPNREIIRSEERVGGLVWKKIVYQSQKEDFSGRFIFDSHLKQLENKDLGFVLRPEEKTEKISPNILEFVTHEKRGN